MQLKVLQLFNISGSAFKPVPTAVAPMIYFISNVDRVIRFISTFPSTRDVSLKLCPRRIATAFVNVLRPI